MSLFQLTQRSGPSGAFLATWFDDDACTWDVPALRTPQTLVQQWVTPALRLHGDFADPPPVLFNPNALAFSATLKAELASFSEIEWLPVQILGRESFHILHVVSAVELPTGAVTLLPSSDGGNVGAIHSFPPDYSPPTASFRVLQPIGSPARRGNRCIPGVFMSGTGKAAIERAAGTHLYARPA